ncbi:MAG: EAL domain-containing protein [Rhodoferax sp.]|nr:EAL domain-containing protein [Rhodoferax sp.]
MRFRPALLRKFYQHWNGQDLGHVQRLRERRMLLVGSAATLLLGVAWGIYFTVLGMWPLVAMDLLLICGGLGGSLLTWHNRDRPAAIVLFSTLFIVICVIAVSFDVPTVQAPRTTHLYLLPLSVAALMAFRTSGVWLRHGIALAGLVAFVILSASYGSMPSQYALPESVRATGAWVQTGASLSIFYAMLYLMQNDAISRSVLENDLRQAVAQDQFMLYFQPQLDAKGGVIGAEALIRWQHPERGLVMPGQFIEQAEQTGLILPIGHWVLEAACAQLRMWSNDSQLCQLRLAVNISQLQFRQVNFVPQVLGMIERYGIKASLLELEITESMLAQDLPDIIAKMTTLRASGVTFSLDDFGTGYSSLNYLKRLPLNQLKIDQSFVRDVLTDPNDASIARTVVTLGHGLGLSVIAEGVETLEQREFLLQSGCEYFQGYLFSRPVPSDDFTQFVKQRPSADAVFRFSADVATLPASTKLH